MRMIRTSLLALYCIVGASFAASVISFEDDYGECSDQYSVGTKNACIGYFCNKSLSSMFIFMTHNSYATEDRVYAFNQNFGEGKQFEAGIRGFNFDIYDENGELMVDHAPSEETWSPAPYRNSVDQILAQLDKCRYRNEIVVVDFEMKKTATGTHKRAMEAWGDKVITNFDATKPFSYYINRGQRVLLLTNSRFNSPSIGIHRRRDFIVQNGYEWTCEMGNYPDFSYREGPKNDQYSAKMMNHFCNTFKLPDQSESEKANDQHVILHNSRLFAQNPDFDYAIPNIISIDFYDKGDIWPAQDLIRRGKEYVGDEWDDGNVCTPGFTCWNCKNEYTFWASKARTACGTESASSSCVADGAVCYKGTSCDDCCSNEHEYWYSKSMTACGSEPCLESGETCGRWSSCNNCCKSDGQDCPWWGLFGCTCG